MPPAIKVTISGMAITSAGSSDIVAVEQVLVANGYVDQADETHAIAHACVHLMKLYGIGNHADIVIEKTPGHYQITVNQV